MISRNKVISNQQSRLRVLRVAPWLENKREAHIGNAAQMHHVDLGGKRDALGSHYSAMNRGAATGNSTK